MNMKRFIHLCFITFLTCFIITVSAEAALIDEVIFTNPEKGTLKINGDTGSIGNNIFISLFILDEGCDTGDIYKNKAAVKYTDSFAAAFDGTYAHSFDFVSAAGSYNIAAVCSDGQKQVYPFAYANWEWIKTEIFYKIKSGEMKGDDIYKNVTTYDRIIGVDLSSVTSERDKNILIRRIENSRAVFDTKYIEILNNVLGEIDLLNKVEKADHWSEVEAALKKYSYISGMSFADYESSNKTAVCSAVKGRRFNYYEDLNSDFYAAVENNPGQSGSNGNGGGKTSSKSGAVKNMGDFTSDPSATTDPEPAFPDMGGYEWANTAVESLYDRKILSGDTNGNFNPGLPIKREELVKIAVLAFGLYDENASCEFSDVNRNDWFYSYVASAADNEIIKGIDEFNFGAGIYITRQDMVVILHRCALSAGKIFDEKNTDFSDFSDISEYAADAVASFLAAGYINGVGEGVFAPQRTAARAEIAKIVYNILEEK